MRRRCFYNTRIQVKADGGEYGSAVTLSFSSAASQQQITLRSNRSWEDKTTLYASMSKPNWAHLSIASGIPGETAVTVSVDRNDAEEARGGRTGNVDTGFVLAPLNNRTQSILYLSQAAGQIPTYTISFVNGNISLQSIHRIDYVVNGSSGYLTDISSEQIIPGRYQSGTVISFTAMSTGYYTQVGTGTVQNHNLQIVIDLEKINPATRYFEITAVEARPDTNGWYQNSMMPDGTALLHRECPELTVVYNTNIENITPEFSYLSGSSNWISGISEDVAITPPTGNNQTFTLTYVSDNLDTSVFNKANIAFRGNGGSIYAELPVMTTVDENVSPGDTVYLSSASTLNPTQGALTFNVGASAETVDVWVKVTNVTAKILFDRSSGLRFFNGDTGEEIVGLYTPGETYTGPYVLFPDLISDTVISLPFHLVISVPKNTSTSSGKQYSITLETEYYDEMDLNYHDHAEITINQAQNQIYHDDFYIDEFWLAYNSQGYQASALTIPSSAITYDMGREDAIMTCLNIHCREHDAAGTIDSDVPYTAITASSGTSIAVDGSKIQIELPQGNWIYEANGTGGTNQEYIPIAGYPWRLNAKAHQGYDTGTSRTGDVTAKWVGGFVKEGADSAKTVAVTQVYGKKEYDPAVFIHKNGSTVLPDGTLTTSGTITGAGASISFELSAVSGTQIMFGNYMGDTGLNRNLQIIIDGQEITTSSYVYTATTGGLKSMTIKDKNYSSSYDVNVFGTVTAPTGYSNSPLTFSITR